MAGALLLYIRTDYKRKLVVSDTVLFFYFKMSGSKGQNPIVLAQRGLRPWDPDIILLVYAEHLERPYRAWRNLFTGENSIDQYHPAGSVILNAADTPFSISENAVTVPLCCSIMLFTMESPRPMPLLASGVREEEPVQLRSNT